mmetsp:Transcript_36033/g.87525  ORF Transcript_36033/g.87525 Transcript_36033/m.87525 type:complete len:272 (-) Transcript_36033:820-1635(-)
MPEVGSSRKMVREPPIRAMPRHSLRFCPPESAPAGVCLRSESFTCSSICSTASCSAAPKRPLSAPYSRRCCVGVRLSKITFTCGQTPRERRICAICDVMLLPSMRASPADGAISPVSIEMVVVFPAPLAPSSAVICPAHISRSSECTATPRGHTLRSPAVRTPASPTGCGRGSTTIVSSLALAVARRGAPLPLLVPPPHQYDGWSRNHGLRCRPYSEGTTWSKYQARQSHRIMSKKRKASDAERGNSPSCTVLQVMPCCEPSYCVMSEAPR